MNRKTIIGIVAALVAIAAIAWQFGPELLRLAGRQVDPGAQYRAGRYVEAADAYRRLMADGDATEQTVYNLGTSLLGADSLTAASEVLERASRARTEEVRYRALFNHGLANLVQGLAEEGEAAVPALDAAVASYKNALIMRSGEVDAKWNYELALREQEQNSGGGGGGGGAEESPSSAPDPSAQPEAPAPRPAGGLGQQQAEQILNSAARDEREVQEKRRERAQPPKTRTGKDW